MLQEVMVTGIYYFKQETQLTLSLTCRT